MAGCVPVNTRNSQLTVPESKLGISRARAARLLVGNRSRQWARAPTRWNRSVYGVGGSVVGLEARSGREEPQLNGSLFEHCRVSSRAKTLAEKNPPLRMAQLG